MNLNIGKFILPAALAAVLGSCSSNNGLPKNDGTAPVAYFENFVYTGNDDFYNQNALAGDDYFYNPILPGWYSDPSICSNGKDYFLVTSTFSYFPGVPIFHSTDLVHWDQIGHVLNRESQLPLNGQRTSEGIFAPAIEYNPYNQTYYMITTNIRRGNFFVKTQDPFGEWSDPIWLPEVGGIDPSFFFDDNGKAYIVNNDEPEGTPRYDGHRAIRIREFDVKTDKVIGENKVLLDAGVRPEENPIWIEGPHMYKINGKYFLMSAEGGTGDGHSEVILRGNSPMGKFTPWDKNPILTQRHLPRDRQNPITCAGHADLVQDADGEWWGVFLACRPINHQFENLGRETFLLPVRWSEDGYPYFLEGDETIDMIVPKKGLGKAREGQYGNFCKVENFTDTKLPMEWMTMRGTGDDLYSLDAKPGSLAIYSSKNSASDTEATPSFISRRMQHHKFECTTTMTFNPSKDSEEAGILLYKDENHQYFFALSNNEDKTDFKLYQIGKEGPRVLSSVVTDKLRKAVDLKVVSTGNEYEFFYSTDKGAKWNEVAKGISAHYLSTSNSYGFTGTTIGVYAYENEL